MREALRRIIERCHNVVHEADRKIAVVYKVRVIVIVRQRRKLLVHLARFLIRAEVIEHKVRIIVVGIDKYALLRIGERKPLHVRLLRQLAVGLLFRKDHHQRHLVHTGAVIPCVRIIKPRLPRGEICIGKAYIVRLHAVSGILLNKAVCHRLQLIRVKYGHLRFRGLFAVPCALRGILSVGKCGARQRNAYRCGKQQREECSERLLHL